MLLSIRDGLSLFSANVVCAILERTPGSDPLSDSVALRYLIEVAASRSFPSMDIRTFMPVELPVINFVFSALISIH